MSTKRTFRFSTKIWLAQTFWTETKLNSLENFHRKLIIWQSSSTVPTKSSSPSLAAFRKHESTLVKTFYLKLSFVRWWAIGRSPSIVAMKSVSTSSTATPSSSFRFSFSRRIPSSISRRKFLSPTRQSTHRPTQTFSSSTTRVTSRSSPSTVAMKSALFLTARQSDWKHPTAQLFSLNSFQSRLAASAKRFTFALTTERSLRLSSDAMSFQSTFSSVSFWTTNLMNSLINRSIV